MCTLVNLVVIFLHKAKLDEAAMATVIIRSAEAI